MSAISNTLNFNLLVKMTHENPEACKLQVAADELSFAKAFYPKDMDCCAFLLSFGLSHEQIQEAHDKLYNEKEVTVQTSPCSVTPVSIISSLPEKNSSHPVSYGFEASDFAPVGRPPVDRAKSLSPHLLDKNRKKYFASEEAYPAPVADTQEAKKEEPSTKEVRSASAPLPSTLRNDEMIFHME